MAERSEDDARIHAIQELWAEGLLQLFVDLRADQAVLLFCARPLAFAARTEAERRRGLDLSRTKIGGHDQDHVAEVDATPLRIRELAILQDLQEDVEDFAVRLLNFVKKHHGVRSTADRLGKLSTIIKANVSRRRANESARVVALHKLAHINLDQRVFRAEHELSERLGELRLSNACRPEEEEAADRALRVFQSGAGAANRATERADRLLLADHSTAEHLLHLEEACRLCLCQSHHWDPRPHGNHRGDLFVGHLWSVVWAIRNLRRDERTGRLGSATRNWSSGA